MRNTRREKFVIIGILAIVCVFTLVDMFTDLSEGANLTHLAAEGGVALLSLLGIAFLWKRASELKAQMVRHQIEASKWKAEAATALRGLSEAIDAQLSRWQLTKAEKDVALLLLKGLSLKEIAGVRAVSEKTVRAQTFTIYSKAGLSGRAELSAFFLEDLMLPQELST